ncbi:hypothetical protein SynRCC2555_00977 [Synechococcus sp. WH 8101]|nr:hypothetical protein SynRCC2555_00977 [Synechococcus sp. WH 8101]
MFMTRTRDFHRFHRWTAKLRRRSLRQALPEPREGELQPTHPVAEVRCREWQRDQLHDLIELDEAEAIA